MLPFTCDGMLGSEIGQNFAARRQAQKRIRSARMVFTTCIGAGLGLLRQEHFDTVIIDESSQQTEPASLVPLVKGCQRAILVGDHVQLRATVQPNAATQGYDISLFERLWTESTGTQSNAVQKTMLNIQYRMHPGLCAFPSAQFYDGKLLTAADCAKIPLPQTASVWPGDGKRTFYIQCDAPEDLGKRSKSNSGQAKICNQLVRKLLSPPSMPSPNPTPINIPPVPDAGGVGPSNDLNPPSIAVLTPYTRQLQQLRQLIPDPAIRISTIDGFQGQEADVIIYVTVRCNVYGEIGFLKDLRRLNVAITRPRAVLIIIGDRDTLTKGRAGREVDSATKVWRELIASCASMERPAD